LAETLEVQLERVQTRIAAIENGASEYQVGGRRVKNHELSTLYTREKDLLNRIAIRDNGSVAYAGRPIT